MDAYSTLSENNAEDRSEPKDAAAIAKVGAVPPPPPQVAEAPRRIAFDQEIQHRLDAERRARAQAEAGQAETDILFRLTEAVNRAQELDQVYAPALDAVQAGLGVDRASVLLLDPDGVMRFKAWRGLSDAYRAAVEGHSPWPADALDPSPVLVPDVDTDESLRSYRPLFRAERIRSLGFVPLTHHRRLLGKFMVYGADPRVFTPREIEKARTIAIHIAQAVARSNLFDAERRARAAAERNAETLRRLQSVTASLSRAVTVADVAKVIVAEGLALAGAATGGLWLIEGDAATGVAALAHSQSYDDDNLQQWSRVPLDSATASPVLESIRGGQPVWVQSSEELQARYPTVAAGAGRRAGHQIACLPLVLSDRPLGALAFTFERAEEMDPTMRDFLGTVAHQGEIALERALLFERERRDRAEAEASQRRASFKADASAILASSLDYETTLRNVAKLAVPRFADWCAVELGDSPARTTVVAVEHVNREKVDLVWKLRQQFPVDPDARIGAPQVLRSGKAELYEQIGDDLLRLGTVDARQLEVARSLELRSAIIVPMSVHGRTIGVMSFICAESERRYCAADLEVAVMLGQRAALAVDNARLHGDLQRALTARDDLIGVVSHDMRNLLSLVSMNSASLMRKLPHGDAGDRSRRAAESIKRASDRMERLIGDLLDFGRIEAGRLTLDLQAEDIAALVAQAAEDLGPLAAAKNLCLKTEAPARPVRVRCDRQRVFQVLSNVVGNAIKFTPEGGTISVRASVEGRAALFAVRDTGPGVAPDNLTRIFDRYYQGSNRQVGGVGLGLFIARGIVDAHGGRIWVESRPGEGSQFFFTLPLADP